MFRFIKRVLGFSKTESVRILMYHKVLPEKEIVEKDAILISVEKLEEHFQYIKENFNTVFFKDLKDNTEIPQKLIISFDDGYLNNLQYLMPLLQKYELKATIFIPTEWIQKDENNENRTFMTFDEIRSLNPELIEIALHSHTHQNYEELLLEEAEADLQKNIQMMEDKQIPFTRVFAYPYGQFPRKGERKKGFFSMLERNEILAAIRIGNNIDYFPWRNKFEVKRIDIKGGDSFEVFKWKLRLGKIKL